MSFQALIIDDNELNLHALKLLLQQEGGTVITAASPQEAVRLTRQIANLDVIFLDLELPQVTGLEFIKTLRKTEQHANVPIIAYTVHISEQNEARAAGFDGFLGKPLDVNRFSDQLRRILQGESVWEAT